VVGASAISTILTPEISIGKAVRPSASYIYTTFTPEYRACILAARQSTPLRI
jgi:hypothetical protein